MIMSRDNRRAWGEGGVYQRADGKWVGSIELHGVNGKRQRHVFYGKTKAEVVTKRKEAIRRLEADEPVKDAKVTVAALVDDYLTKALPASSRKLSTQENYGFIARKHLAPPPFGALTLDRLRPSDLEMLLVSKRDAGYADSTVRLVYTVCRGMLDIAVRDGLVRRCQKPHTCGRRRRKNHGNHLQEEVLRRQIEPEGRSSRTLTGLHVDSQAHPKRRHRLLSHDTMLPRTLSAIHASTALTG
jgi:hypothetical protein